ncbi:MAG: Tn3 family transposase [Bryobacteraceae bacterium]
MIANLRELPLDKQQEVLDFASFLKSKEARPLESLEGLWAGQGVDTSEEDIADPDLRYRVQLQLNRGESRHELVGRCLFFANRDEFRTGDAEEIMNKASCLSLISNAVLVWNTMRITDIVDQLRNAGHEIADQDLARVSPLMHPHVIPNGTYRFFDETEPRKPVLAAAS